MLSRQIRLHPLIKFGWVAILLALGIRVLLYSFGPTKKPGRLNYQPRQPIETSGFLEVFDNIKSWEPNASLEEYAASYENAVPRGLVKWTSI